jgi:hypothetical protein
MSIERQMEDEYIDGMVAQAKADPYLVDALIAVKELNAALSEQRPVHPHWVRHIELLLAACGTVEIDMQFQATRAWMRHNGE